jgi:hypothetical protein
MRIARCGSEEESSLIAGMVQGCDGSAAQGGPPMKASIIEGDWKTWKAKP